jgi:hypothetical protein
VGVVRETDDDGTVSLGFEGGIGVWLPYDALERESDLERRTSEIAAMAAAKEEAAKRRAAAAAAAAAAEKRARDEQGALMQPPGGHDGAEGARAESAAAQLAEVPIPGSAGSDSGESDDSAVEALLDRLAPAPPAAAGEEELGGEEEEERRRRLLLGPGWRAQMAACYAPHHRRRLRAGGGLLPLMRAHVEVLQECIHVVSGGAAADADADRDVVSHRGGGNRRSPPRHSAGSSASAAAAASSAAAAAGLMAPLPLSPLGGAPSLGATAVAVGGQDAHGRDARAVWVLEHGVWREVASARLPFLRRQAAVCALADGSLFICGGVDVDDKSGIGHDAPRPALFGLEAPEGTATLGSSVTGTDTCRADVYGVLLPGGQQPGPMDRGGGGRRRLVGWRRLADMPTRRRGARAVGLPDGRALVIGGSVHLGGREQVRGLSSPGLSSPGLSAPGGARAGAPGVADGGGLAA